MSFENLVGNNKIKQLLKNSIETNNLVHSYLFVGIPGIGKNLFAQEFAKTILCSSKTDKRSCNKCKSCIEFNTENNPDFIKIETIDNKNIKIDQIRQMQSKVIEKPVNSIKKIYIINDAELMTIEAQNCLLKTLEEPPEYIVIILITSNEDKLLTTIKSRCMRIKFEKIEKEELKQILKTKYGIEEVSDNILELSGGSIGNALKLKDKREQYDGIEEIIENMYKNDKVDIFNKSELLYFNKEEIFDLLDYMNVTLYKLGCNDKEKMIKSNNCIEYVEKAKKKLRANSNYDMTIDELLLKIWEEINEKYCRS